MELRYTLVTDGPSDQILLEPLTWLLRQHISSKTAVQPSWADLRHLRRRPEGLKGRLQTALELFPCDLLFVHRDAETASRKTRVKEIQLAVNSLDNPIPTVCVVPVRMQEAWLLLDEIAIRRAAGNPNGRMQLTLPANAERVANPKEVLYHTLRAASGLTGRRLKKFRFASARRRVVELIDDFSILRRLKAFQALEAELHAMIQSHHWA